MEPIGDELRSELARFGPQGAIGDTVAVWPSAVGEEIARHAWPARFTRDGTLLVNTRDAIWSFELTQRAAEISARLPTKPKLKFAPGPLPEATPERPAAAEQDPPQATLEQAREAARWASEIEDEELRELVARAARASLARASAERPDDRSF
jgi:predicted nucleic acid-binding Zn ribbon protein